MENLTFRYHTLSIEGLKVTPQSSYPVFVLLLLVYIFIMASNIGLLILISVDKNLYDPMHILFCNLPMNDIIGTSVVVPSILKNIFREPPDRSISYVECVIQAYFVHLFATNSHSMLMIMAFDRYVAIHNPLRYPSIMTNTMVVKLTASAWGIPAVLVGILIGLTARLSHCTSTITHPICDNASLFKLSCEDITINNIYGLSFTVILLVSSLGSIVITYLRIAIVCLTSKNKRLNSKAMKTCSTHLTVYVIMFVSGFTIILLHRFPQYSENRKLAAIMFHIVPPMMNPIIYGAQTNEIRQRIYHIFRTITVGM